MLLYNQVKREQQNKQRVKENKTTMYKKPVYSKEQYKRWTEQEERRHEYLEKHTHETKKKYKINDLYIFLYSNKI